MDIDLVIRERKSAVLKTGTFGCLKGMPTINVTMGCLIGCAYCYARAYPGVRDQRGVVLFSNLVEKLDRELSRRRKPVHCVLFNTSSDSFQPHPDIINTSLSLMEFLLDRGISLSFLTKGKIPDRFYEMASRAPGRISPRIGIVSISQEYQRIFEPRAATPTERLRAIERLCEAGMRPEARIDPVIPFVTDSKKDLDLLFQRLGERGVKRAAISYLHLRPHIFEHLGKSLSPLHQKLIEGAFFPSGWGQIGSSSMTKLIPRPIRLRGYERAREAADRYGVSLALCRCKNPDIESVSCMNGISPCGLQIGEEGRQLDLSFIGNKSY